MDDFYKMQENHTLSSIANCDNILRAFMHAYMIVCIAVQCMILIGLDTELNSKDQSL